MGRPPSGHNCQWGKCSLAEVLVVGPTGLRPNRRCHRPAGKRGLMASRDEVFARSARLRQPQNRQVADAEIPSHEDVLIADDCDLEIVDAGNVTELHQLCAVLTPSGGFV